MKQIAIQNKKLSQLDQLHNALTKYSDCRPGMLKIPQPKFKPDILTNMNTGAYRGVGFDLSELKSYWKFDEASGDIINQAGSVGSVDSLGSGADLQVNGATYGVSGIIDDALSFDGVNDDAKAGTSVSQYNFLHYGDGTPKWTICFWMKWLSTNAGDIFDGSAETSVARGFGSVMATDGHMDLFFGNGTTNVIRLISSASFVPDTTTWHFYSLTYDHSLGSNNMKLKRDDANLEQATKTGNAPNSGDAVGALTLANRTSTGTNFLNAAYDETTIWDRILTDDEITSLYNSGAGLAL